MTGTFGVRLHSALRGRSIWMGISPRSTAGICTHRRIQFRGFSVTAQNKSPKWDPNYMDWREMNLLQKSVEVVKRFGYAGVILFGLCAFGNGTRLGSMSGIDYRLASNLGVAGYHLTTELLSPSSATAIYSDALEKIKEHEEIKNTLGAPLIGHGSGRRHRLTSREVAGSRVDDTRRVMVNFAVEGTNGEAPVSAEVIENVKTKTWDFYTVYVDVMPEVLAKTDPAKGNKVKRIYVIDRRPKRAKNTYKGRRRRWMRGNDVDEEDRPKGRFGFL